LTGIFYKPYQNQNFNRSYFIKTNFLTKFYLGVIVITLLQFTGCGGGNATTTNNENNTTASIMKQIVEDIEGNADNISITAEQLNSIDGISSAKAGKNYAKALEAAKYSSNYKYKNSQKPTIAEIQAIIDAVNSEPDTDKDDIPNSMDIDDDNDGYTDTEEIKAKTDPLDPLSNPTTRSNKILAQIGKDHTTGESNITILQLKQIIPSLKDINSSNETAYRAYIANANSRFSDPATRAELQYMIYMINRTKVDKTDTTPPTLTIKGSNPATVEAGSTYADAGAEASDNIDGDITSSITTTNSVNTSRPGDYTVTYSVQDSAGNEVNATRVVRVVDTTPPTLTLVGNTLVIVEAGDTYTDAGATAVDIVDGNLTSSITTTNDVNTSQPGDYNVTYTVQDSSGNEANATRVVRVQTRLSIDGTPKLSTDGNFTFSYRDGDGTGALKWSSSDKQVATIDQTSGLINIIGTGITTITLTKEADSKYNSQTATYELNVTDPIVRLDVPTKAFDNDIIDLKAILSSLSGSRNFMQSWRQIGGSNIKIFNSSALKASFVAPNVESDTDFEFEFTLTDMQSSKESKKQITITIKHKETSVPLSVDLKLQPVKKTYKESEAVSFVAKVKGSNIQKVDFYVDNNKIDSVTSEPYQFVWTASGIGQHTIKAELFDINGNKKVATKDITVKANVNADSNFTFTTTRRDAAWERVIIRVKNNNNSNIDINKGVLVFTIPNNIPIAIYPQDYSGVSWLGYKLLETVAINKSNNFIEHRVTYNFNKLSYVPDTTLSNGEYFELRLSDTNNKITDSIFNQYFAPSNFNFIFPDDIATTSRKVAMGSKPTGLNSNKIPKIIVKNNTTNETYTQMISWGSEFNMLGLLPNNSYTIWGETFIDGDDKYDANYTKESPYTFTASANMQTLDISYAKITLVKSQVNLKFANVPSVAKVDIAFLSKTDGGKNIFKYGVDTDQDLDILLPNGKYTVRVSDYNRW